MDRSLRMIAALALTMALVLPAALSVAPAHAATQETYLVLFKGNSVSLNAITQAGGTLVARYDAIGVAVARSDRATFATQVRKDARIEGASATTRFGTALSYTEVTSAEVFDPNAPASDNDPLSYLQWDMRQIKTPEAHAITGGSPSVVVGDLDTGLDFSHPDLAANYDATRSADCSSGAPTTLLPNNDHNGHGTHTAGTIAAASNGVGIVGVAPNVKIAGIKTSNDDGYFFPEMVVCAFVWAAEHGIHVTNNSYFADPWLFNCRNDPEQRAIWKAEQRAIRYAMQRGVTVVSSAGNGNQDYTHPSVDDSSPDYPPGSEIEREVTNACVKIPAEIPGVITVSANGVNGVKSYYSDYGIGFVQVVAPGGDARFQTNAPGGGRVLSTYLNGGYAYLQGTSMAGPHVAGIAALIISQHGSPMAPGAVQARINQSADPIPCPEGVFLAGTPFEAVCQGNTAFNGFYGHGQVNALQAVLH
jgi:lantibiotic leader peptide-processing serine protease